jgi:hypothetical protein
VWRPRSNSYDDRALPEPSVAREAAPSAGESAGSGASRRAPASAPQPRRGAAADGYAYDDEAPRKRKGGGSGSGGPSNIGTLYGESHDSSVVEVSFERRSPTHPSAVLALRYDDYEGLEARGIDLSSLSYAYRYEAEPEPFPHRRFAQPP